MKLISLNVWGGVAGREKLLDFFVATPTRIFFVFRRYGTGATK